MLLQYWCKYHIFRKHKIPAVHNKCTNIHTFRRCQSCVVVLVVSTLFEWGKVQCRQTQSSTNSPQAFKVAEGKGHKTKAIERLSKERPSARNGPSENLENPQEDMNGREQKMSVENVRPHCTCTRAPVAVQAAREETRL